MKRGGVLLIAAWLTLGVAVSLADTLDTPGSSRPCREDPNVVGPCFAVRGRMNYWNGSPSVRIWKVGTRRILGVSTNRTTQGYCTIPRDLVDKLSWDADLFADFVVCPFSVEQRQWFNMKDYVEITEEGKNYVGLYDAVSKDA